jgi:hypothetical protein
VKDVAGQLVLAMALTEVRAAEMSDITEGGRRWEFIACNKFEFFSAVKLRNGSGDSGRGSKSGS